MYSAESQQLIRLAEKLALEYAHPEYSAGHILWAVGEADVGLSFVLEQLGKEPFVLQGWGMRIIEKLPKSPRYVESPKADRQAQAVIKETQKLSLRYGNPEISPLDFLEALFTPDVGFDSATLRRMPIALYEIIEWRNSHEKDAAASADHEFSPSNGVSGQGKDSQHHRQILDKYCEDLNALARAGKIDPVIGRDVELKQLMEILGKRLSPNVLIVGAPGVGKTSIVGGLTLKILEGTVPASLSNTSIMALDVSGRLVAGAFKGEVEERMKSILRAIRKHGGKIILFIDEIHILLDERGPVGSGVVNLLKPELARGEITVIGATTQAEFQKFIEKDAAFNRRFTRLTIHEPEETTAIEMLNGLVGKYEAFHQLKVDAEAIPTAIALAKKYERDRMLPASSIELLDFTLSCAVQMNATSRETLLAIEEAWKTGSEGNSERVLRKVKQQLSELLIGRLEEEDQARPETVFDRLRNWTAQPKEVILAEDVEAIMAYRTGIPLGRMRTNEQDKFRNIPETLRRRVVGQDHVIDAVGRGLKAFRTHLKDPREPGAIFFFTGPTGTGKTELAKAIAELLFDDEDAMIRFDMSEYQESASVAALLGASPGYVGYDEGGILINKVRKQPYSVVLFDEIEKAHPDIYGIFLQMLTDGRLTDKQGKLADFSNTVVIFTSNAGAHEMAAIFEQGRHPGPEEVKAILRETRAFKDEFLGRVDSQILPFKPISKPVAHLVLDMHLQKFVCLLHDQHQIELRVTPAVKAYLVDQGFSPVYGARPLKHVIRSVLTPPIADRIIMGEVMAGDTLQLALNESNNLIWTVSKGPSQIAEEEE